MQLALPRCFSIVFLFIWLLVAGFVNAERLPNVVLLIGDDHGYPYFGFMGDQNVSTPTMDTLAEGGVTFVHGHSSASYCRPSLRTLITGLHPIQYTYRKNRIVEKAMKKQKDYDQLSENDRFAREQVLQAAALKEFDTLPKLLATKGYVSWQGGKWWENSYENGHFTEGMTKAWDEDSVRGKNIMLAMMGDQGTELGRTTMEPLFDFITRRKDEPMFIWYGPQLPHTPLDAPYKFSKYYEHKPISQSAKDYYSNITWWDDGVSQLMDHFESLGLIEDTLFIYISDNGWEQDAQVEYKKDIPDYALDPLYGGGGFVGKGSLYDMSFRSPIIFYWKNHIRGSFNQTSLVKAEDIVPTILDIAGVKEPRGLPGYSLKPMLEGRPQKERTLMVGYNDRIRTMDPGIGGAVGEDYSGYYVRTQRWHYISRNNGVRELYDITLDERARNNLVEAYPELTEEFEKEIVAWKKKIGVKEWVSLD